LKVDVRSIRYSMWNPSNNAVRVSENDMSRSKFIRDFVQNEKIQILNTLIPTNTTPKLIFQFWDEEDIPKDVQECIETWRHFKSSGIEHFLFNKDTARKFIAYNLGNDYVKAFDRCYHPAMKSDYFRLCFIYSRGGFYVDVDDVYSGCDIEKLFTNQGVSLQPLCFDANTSAMVNPDKFVADGECSEHWIFYFNNNPIIAPPRNPIIEYALARSTHLILECDEDKLPEIQSTTGPGNMSASVVAYLSDLRVFKQAQCLSVLSNWTTYGQTIWGLSYRNDKRNWRLSNRKKYTPI